LGRLIQVRGWVAFGLALVYLAAGAAGLFAEFETTSDLVVWLVLLWGGAVLILACILFVHAVGWLSAALMSLGAAIGGLALFWTILVPIAVAAVISTSFVIARRAPNVA
jgi:hypothetical protein